MKTKIRSPSFCKHTLDDTRKVMKKSRPTSLEEIGLLGK